MVIATRFLYNPMFSKVNTNVMSWIHQGNTENFVCSRSVSVTRKRPLWIIKQISIRISSYQHQLIPVCTSQLEQQQTRTKALALYTGSSQFFLMWGVGWVWPEDEAREGGDHLLAREGLYWHPTLNNIKSRTLHIRLYHCSTTFTCTSPVRIKFNHSFWHFFF